MSEDKDIYLVVDMTSGAPDTVYYAFTTREAAIKKASALSTWWAIRTDRQPLVFIRGIPLRETA